MGSSGAEVRRAEIVMNERYRNRELVLAIFPATKGFGFALFEGSEMLVDWGVKLVQGQRKNTQCLRRIRELIAFYHPEIVVISSYVGSHRARRIQTLINSLSGVASKEGIPCNSFSRTDVQRCFSMRGARSKRQIAEAIARDFPELAPRLPPVRRIWMSEDARMSIFDAVALGITFFHSVQKRRRAA